MRRSRRTAVAITGAAATLALHSLLFVATIWSAGPARQPRLPERVGAGANTSSAEGSSDERRIIIQLQPEAKPDTPTPALLPVMLEVPRKVSLLAITGPDALPMAPLFLDQAGEETSASEADMVARTQLAGLYEGQIRARIERAWLRPREPIGEDKFACRVLIRQSAQGVIGEIEVQQCNGSDRWQRSLTDAIFAASPLPAPPNPQVFADSFSMRFEAPAYSDGAPGGLYESESRVAAQITPSSALTIQSGDRPRAAASTRDESNQVYLNITADKIEWSTTPLPRHR